MHQRTTRRTKNTPLINLSNSELAELERTSRTRKRTTVEMDLPQGLMHDEEGEQLPPPQQPQAVAERTLGDYNRPDQFYANRAAIRIPTFQRNDFELKPAYFALVGQHPFTGLSHEHPMDHIEKFEDLVTSMKYNGVPQEYLFCKLFPYSLGGEAAYWLKQLPPGSLATWNETKNAFLNNFYDDARSEELRNKISQFSQGPTEALKAAWVRFRSYQRDCPHHGFSQVQLLGIFYRGIDWRYQMALDSASNGNFNTRIPTDAVKLIENLASSNSTKNADFERKRLASVADSSQIAEVQAKLDTMHNLLVGRTTKAVHFAEEIENTEDEVGNVNYVGGSGFQSQRFGYNNNNLQGGYKSGGNQSGFGATQFAQKPLQGGDFTRQYGNSAYQPHSPKSTESKTEILLEQILQGQEKMVGDFNRKLDNVYTDLNGRIDTLEIHQKMLENQIAQTSAAVKGKMVQPQHGHVNAITSSAREEDFEPEMTAFVFSNTSIDRYLPGIDRYSPRSAADSKVAEDEDEDKNSDIPRVSIDTPTCVDRHQTAETIQNSSIDRHSSGIGRYPSQAESITEKRTEMVEERVYKPKLGALNLSQKKLETPIAENPVNLAGDDEWDAENPRVSIDTIPVSIDTGTVPKEDVEPVKERVYKPKLPYPIIPKLTREEWEAARSKFLSKKMVTGPPVADTPPPLRQLTKREDPGKFSVPCSIYRVNFKESLVDSGSSVNVMSRAIAERLKADMRSPNTLLTYADSSSSLPYATILDLPVKIGDCLIPTDFQVVEMSQGSKVPLILGRPFMATVGAIMDTPNKRISFSCIDGDVFYDAIPSRGAPRLVSRITIASGETLMIDLLDESYDEPKVAEVSNEPPQHPKKVVEKTKATKRKATSKKINGAANFTLIPQKCDGDSIEYKVKSKGTSKPFSKARVLIPTEMKEKKEDMMSKTLKLEMSGCGAYFGVRPPPCPN